jgi:hypothetical protein
MERLPLMSVRFLPILLLPFFLFLFLFLRPQFRALNLNWDWGFVCDKPMLAADRAQVVCRLEVWCASDVEAFFARQGCYDVQVEDRLGAEQTMANLLAGSFLNEWPQFSSGEGSCVRNLVFLSLPSRAIVQ